MDAVAEAGFVDLGAALAQAADADGFVRAYAKGNEDGAIAAQAAIWGIEYGVAVSSSDTTIQKDITADLMVMDNGRGRSFGLIADDGQQGQISGGVPEPASWAMMLTGFFGVGGAIRLSRRQRGLATA